MTNWLTKSSLLATAGLAIGAYASPSAAFPKKLAYTFYPGSGGSYCDRITLTSPDKLAYHGYHVNSDCAGSKDPAEGLVVRLGNRKVIEVITGDAGLPDQRQPARHARRRVVAGSEAKRETRSADNP